MIVLSKPTCALMATFMAVSLVTAGCSETTDENLEENENTSLVDDNGNSYTLHKNSDGTETAKYDNGDEVTFKRDDDGNLNFVSGTAGLLTGLAAGYFLSRGFSPSSGYYDTTQNRYVSNTRPSVISSEERKERLSKYKKDEDKNSGGRSAAATNSSSSNSSPSNSSSDKNSAKSNNSKNTSNSNSSTKSSTSQSNSSKSSVSSSTAKSGFGSAGARSGGSAAS